MRKLVLLVAGFALAGVLGAPAASHAWTSVGLGIGYAGPYVYPYAYPYPYPYPPPGYYPPPYYPPVAYYPPPVYWPSYGPDVAVRWNRYFAPEEPQIRGYTLPR